MAIVKFSFPNKNEKDKTPATRQGAEAPQGGPATRQGAEAPQVLTIIEKANRYKTILDSEVGPIRGGIKVAGISYRTAKRYIAILDLIEPMQERVASGHIGLIAGSEIARIDHKKQHILYRYLEGQGDKGNLSAGQAREIAQCKRLNFLEFVRETLESEKTNPTEFYGKVRRVLEENGVEMSERELLNIITAAIIAYKNKGELS